MAAVPILMLLFTVLAFRHSTGTSRARGAGVGAKRLLSVLSSIEQRERVVDEKVVWTGYARVYSRTVAYADGRPNVTFDVWGRTWRGGIFGVAIVVPFDRRTRTFTLVREFCVAHGRFVYSFPAGQVEAKHGDARHGAVAELAEEARLECVGPLRELLDAAVAAPQDKFQREAVSYYLCDDARRLSAEDAPQRDKEELIDVVHGVTASELVALVHAGVMQSNMIAASMLAIRELETRRLL